MKPLLITAALLGLSLSSVHAADPAPATKTAPAGKTTKKEEPKKEEVKKEAAPKAEKPLPFNHKVDEIDAAAKTLTYTTEKGDKVVNTVTDKTEIKNAGKDATLADIKVGDVVSGSRIKKSETAYDIVKITKFGPAEAKAKPDPKADTKATKKG